MKKFIKNLFVGGVLGFIAGLLFAPSKGEETRKKVEEAVQKGKEKFEEIKSSLKK
ncbi:YtxH domain-containing protein [Candidatus Saganbacteria bacterium]|nr:YtxH domain-containing protein [Candidatus Saganbacteria bacterium]